MFRFVGYAIGTLATLVLGIIFVHSQLYFLITALLDIAAIIFAILFRILASKFIGFWKVWVTRWKKSIHRAISCL